MLIHIKSRTGEATTTAQRKLVMGTRFKDLWGDTLRTMGDRFAPLANFPEDPSLN